jgi:hypothetical protein
MPPETEPANTDAARTETGEIKDQTTLLTEPTTKAETKAETKEESTEAKEKPSLLNDKSEKLAGGAPEKYDFKVPEGFILDELVSKEAGDLFRGLDLSQEGAQQLLDFYIAKTKESADAPFKLWADTQEKWVNEVKADPELGSKLPQVKATISKAIDGLGDAKLAADFRQAMDYTGAGNNPAFIRAFFKLAQALTEGSHVAGAGPSKFGQARPGAMPESAAKAMYPTLP